MAFFTRVRHVFFLFKTMGRAEVTWRICRYRPPRELIVARAIARLHCICLSRHCSIGLLRLNDGNGGCWWGGCVGFGGRRVGGVGGVIIRQLRYTEPETTTTHPGKRPNSPGRNSKVFGFFYCAGYPKDHARFGGERTKHHLRDPYYLYKNDNAVESGKKIIEQIQRISETAEET